MTDSEKVNLQVSLDVKSFGDAVTTIGEACEPPITSDDVAPLAALLQRLATLTPGK
jgi:hypothetical protein